MTLKRNFEAWLHFNLVAVGRITNWGVRFNEVRVETDLDERLLGNVALNGVKHLLRGVGVMRRRVLNELNERADDVIATIVSALQRQTQSCGVRFCPTKFSKTKRTPANYGNKTFCPVINDCPHSQNTININYWFCQGLLDNVVRGKTTRLRYAKLQKFSKTF